MYIYIHTTNLYHDTAPICIAILFVGVLGSWVVGTLTGESLDRRERAF